MLLPYVRNVRQRQDHGHRENNGAIARDNQEEEEEHADYLENEQGIIVKLVMCNTLLENMCVMIICALLKDIGCDYNQSEG